MSGIRSDLHTHTTWCDGAGTAADMAAAAAALGMDCLGFSGHSYTAFDTSYCMSREGTEEYISEIRRLKEEYAGKMRILCGIEQDYWAEARTEPYDYVIGSVHYVRRGTEEVPLYVPVDESPELERDFVLRVFGGDWYAFAEAYFETAADVVRRTDCDIIGHFDLVSKFNEREGFFDEGHPRYAAAWKRALDELLPCGRPFEVNTGAISRGWRTQPYPNGDMIRYICENGGKLILSSDSHRPDTLCYQFDEMENLVKKIAGQCGAEALVTYEACGIGALRKRGKTV